MNKRPVIIDCDPGVDDTVAIMLANSYEGFDIRALTTVAGNVGIEYTTRNALDVSHAVGLKTIVAKGAEKPILIEFEDASYAHGKTGLGGLTLPTSPQVPDSRHAWDVIYDEAVKAEGDLEIIAIGPLTNIAIFIKKYHDSRKLIKKITIMGGSKTYGNTYPYGEFNIWCDPLAADIVFTSEIPLEMIGLEPIYKGKISADDMDDLLKIDSSVKPIMDGLFGFYRQKMGSFGKPDWLEVEMEPSAPLCDAMTIATIIHPEIAKRERHLVRVEVSNAVTRGRTICETNVGRFDCYNTIVVTEIDRLGFKNALIEMLHFYQK